ncbi:hypothetical protein LCGC14_2886420, partial [marine sediment metagenome]
MTAPIVIQQRGPLEGLQQVFTPILEALKDRRSREAQQAQFAQRQALLERQLDIQEGAQERSQAATFLMAAIGQGVSATDPIIAQFEETLGAPGMAKALIGATERSTLAENRAFERSLETGEFSDVVKRALRVDRALSSGPNPPTADIRSQIFQQIAPGEESALDAANLENLKARTKKLNRELIATEEPTMEQQRRAASALDVTGDAFLPFIDYAGILTTRLKQKESDPTALVMRTALSLIAQSTDLTGQATTLPQEAVSVAMGVIRGLIPGAR